MKLDIFLDPGWKFSLHRMVFHKDDSQSTRPRAEMSEAAEALGGCYTFCVPHGDKYHIVVH